MTKKIVGFFLIFFCVVFLMQIKVNADDEFTTMKNNMKNVGNVNVSGTKTQKLINSVIKIVRVAGSGVAMIITTWIGVKYILASPQEKADYKKEMMPLLIGAIVLFGASNLVGIIAQVGVGLG